MSIRQPPTARLNAVEGAVQGRLDIPPQIHLTLGIINNTGRDITVITRTGMKYVLASHRGYQDRTLYFRQGLRSTTDTRVDLNPMLQPPQGAGKSTAERLYASLQTNLSPRPILGVTRAQEGSSLSALTLEELQEAGGTLYVSELDLVVSTLGSHQVIYHPFSVDGVCEALKPEDLKHASLQYQIYIVDNRHSYGPRYTNIHERVFQVPILRRPAMEDGVYAVHPMPSMVGGVRTEYVTHHLSMEEAEKAYFLYRTPEEAETFGFSKEAMERENMARKREREEKQDQREDIRYERAETQQERKDRLDREKEEQQRRNQAQEDRAAIRRDIVDILKFVSAIVITVTGFCATVIKLKPGK